MLDPSSAAIKQRMEKDVDEVKKTAHYLKTKVEELDKEVRTLLRFIQYLDSCYYLRDFTPYSIMYCRIWLIGRSLVVEKDQLLTGQEQQRQCQ